MGTAPADPEHPRRPLRPLWTAMLSALGLYAAVGFLVTGRATPRPESEIEWLRYAFTIAGLVLGGASVWWRRRFLPAELPEPGTEAVIGVAPFQGHSVITWAMSEAVGLCGLMLAIVARSGREFVPFGLAAAALLVLHHPSRLPFDRVSKGAS